MKIKLSKNQWETLGKKAGWLKESSLDSFDHRDPKNYAPGQTPYADEEWKNVKGLISDSAEAGVSEEEEAKLLQEHDSNTPRRRHIKVRFNDGQELETEVNGTVEEVRKYYLPYGNRGVATDYDVSQPDKTHYPVDVEFLS